jgi:hypothetical protein
MHTEQNGRAAHNRTLDGATQPCAIAGMSECRWVLMMHANDVQTRPTGTGTRPHEVPFRASDVSTRVGFGRRSAPAYSRGRKAGCTGAEGVSGHWQPLGRMCTGAASRRRPAHPHWALRQRRRHIDLPRGHHPAPLYARDPSGCFRSHETPSARPVLHLLAAAALASTHATALKTRRPEIVRHLPNSTSLCGGGHRPRRCPGAGRGQHIICSIASPGAMAL